MDIPAYRSGFYYTPGRFTASLSTSGHSLPCLEQANKFYNICFRLADSQPQHVLDEMELELEVWRAGHPNEKYPELAEQRAKFELMEKWLHLGHGECILKQDEVREIVFSCLMRHDEKECQIGAFVIMPNHIHLLIKMLGKYSMKELLREIKRETTQEICDCLQLGDQQIWMRGSYTRIVRDPRELNHDLKYIKDNPKGDIFIPVYERPTHRKFTR